LPSLLRDVLVGIIGAESAQNSRSFRKTQERAVFAADDWRVVQHPGSARFLPGSRKGFPSDLGLQFEQCVQ
jgi:hypothetical protein